MAPNTVKTGETEKKSAAFEGAPSIPTWINEEHFIDIVRDMCPGFNRILKFEPALCGGAGENYASIMMRIKVIVELEGSKNCICCYGTATKNLSFMIKTVPQGQQGSALVNLMKLFPKETAMYRKYIPEFEQLYADVGKQVAFGPKHFTLTNDPGFEYVLLEDLGPHGFKNINRLDGLDQEHTEATLKLLAELHAASAVRYDTKGEYEESLLKGLFSEQNRAFMEGMMNSMMPVKVECYSKYNINANCMDKLLSTMGKFMDMNIKLTSADPEDFNVMNHGDMWSNNIMFRHDDQNKLLETILVDFQISRYGSPAIDLYYFLMSSVKLELKCSMFDHFIKYYHTHLVENLKLLKYSKKIPTMKDLRVQLLKNSYYAYSTITGVMAPVLLDPTENANMEAFVGTGDEARKFKMRLYNNARYTKHMETIMPWLETRGLLDF